MTSQNGQLVEQLRRIVAVEIGSEVARRENEGLQPLEPDDRTQMAQAILRRELDRQWRAAQRRGDLGLTPEEEETTIRAVLAGLFSQMPGLEVQLARPEVTDIFVVGCDNVRVRTIDGGEEKVDPVAGTDEELVQQIQSLARRGGRLGLDDADTPVEKEFSPARPILDLQLSDGSRLAAMAWVSARPYISIRRHPLVDATQKTLVRQWGMYDEGMASLLSAAMRARLNVLIAGGMGRGKTTLMRALLHECPPAERIIVLEQEQELQLGATGDQHDHVLEMIERPPNMEGRGHISLADLTWAVKRHAPDRIVIGEVRGPEVMYMLEAASDGIAGTLCTLHARSSLQTFEKLVNYARRDGASFDRADVLQTAAFALDLIVYLDKTPDGKRVISEVTQVLDYDSSDNRVITNEWFIAGPDNAAIRNPTCPIPVDIMDTLMEHGYNPYLHQDPGSGYGPPGSAQVQGGVAW